MNILSGCHLFLFFVLFRYCHGIVITVKQASILFFGKTVGRTPMLYLTFISTSQSAKLVKLPALVDMNQPENRNE